MGICLHYETDARCAGAVRSGDLPRGCISCLHAPSLGPCRMTGRGRDAGDGRGYLSLSGRIESWEDDADDADI